jgi:hypothetical protein
MEHKKFAEARYRGEAIPARTLTRAERLERWAAALERLGPARLATLWRTEYVATNLRPSLRADHSPLTVAFDDPVLRIAGLNDDSYGEARRFFELSHNDLHWIVCYCHHGESISASTAAQHVRTLIARAAMSPGRRMLHALLGR